MFTVNVFRHNIYRLQYSTVLYIRVQFLVSFLTYFTLTFCFGGCEVINIHASRSRLPGQWARLLVFPTASSLISLRGTCYCLLCAERADWLANWASNWVDLHTAARSYHAPSVCPVFSVPQDVGLASHCVR